MKDLQLIVNEVSEKVKALTESHKDVSEKVKTLAESKKAMKEELLRLQKDLENMTKEELLYLDSMESKNKSSSKNLLSLFQAGMLIFVSKWMMIFMYMLALKFGLKN